MQATKFGLSKQDWPIVLNIAIRCLGLVQHTAGLALGMGYRSRTHSRSLCWLSHYLQVSWGKKKKRTFGEGSLTFSPRHMHSSQISHTVALFLVGAEIFQTNSLEISFTQWVNKSIYQPWLHFTEQEILFNIYKSGIVGVFSPTGKQ